MTEIRVYVNERGVTVPAGASALDAVRAADPALAERVARGEAALADGRLVPLAPDAPLAGGAILRATSTARRAPGADGAAGAHA